MANFASETDVREKFQLTDETLVAGALIEQSITDAHIELLRVLDPVHDTEPAADGLVLGETLLAGAHALRSLASKQAFGQKRVSVGGQRIEDGRRFDVLVAMAASAEDRAWSALEPYLLDKPSRRAAAVNDSTAVLGEG